MKKCKFLVHLFFLDKSVITYSIPDLPNELNISAGAIDPDNFTVACGTEFPSSLIFNFEDELPTSAFFNYNSEVSTVKFFEGSVLCGTNGGTINIWDPNVNTISSRLTGNLTRCTSIQTERNQHNVIVSGAVDTNVKLWDVRQKSCINTFKGHTKDITCLDISPDSKIVVSGSMDGTLKFWDSVYPKLVKSFKVSTTGYPTCIAFNP
jgi:katanin p80 WD40 repeat-containing subunit B1